MEILLITKNDALLAGVCVDKGTLPIIIKKSGMAFN
jgi:hypothetical protein